ncbi:MAG: CBS domain-containing protein [Cyclobacteriaceae bacterium]
MTAKDLINYTIPPLRLSDDSEKAKNWLSEFDTKEFPVVDEGVFHGMFTESMLFDQRPQNQSISSFQLKAKEVTVAPEEHYYDVLKKASAENLSIIAVVDGQGKYLGVITIQDVIEAFSKMSSIKSPGVIIVISIPQIDYSLAEISRIIESEYGKILSSFVENHPEDSSILMLTIKLNVEVAGNIISSLERFGFNVTSVFGKEDEEDIEKERLDTLFKYLKM